MPIYKKNGFPVDRRMNAMLAIRLNQIAEKYPSNGAFEKASGLSRVTLYNLRNGKGNPTFQTLSTLSMSLGLPVWSLIGLRECDVRASATHFGIMFDQIEGLAANVE